MTEKLRLYLEKVIARMNLDDAQRENVEREFTGHVEEAVTGAMRQGHTRSDAEAQAMRVFGEPSVIARQFGLARGYGWLLFERCALGLVACTFVFIMYDNESVAFRVSYAAFLVALVMGVSLWRKVEVNGVLRVRCCFRRTRKIAFDSIADVRFVKGHICGARKIRIETHDRQKAFFFGKIPQCAMRRSGVDGARPSGRSAGGDDLFPRKGLPDSAGKPLAQGPRDSALGRRPCRLRADGRAALESARFQRGIDRRVDPDADCFLVSGRFVGQPGKKGCEPSDRRRVYSGCQPLCGFGPRLFVIGPMVLHAHSRSLRFRPGRFVVALDPKGLIDGNPCPGAGAGGCTKVYSVGALG